MKGVLVMLVRWTRLMLSVLSVVDESSNSTPHEREASLVCAKPGYLLNDPQLDPLHPRSRAPDTFGIAMRRPGNKLVILSCIVDC